MHLQLILLAKIQQTILMNDRCFTALNLFLHLFKNIEPDKENKRLGALAI
jgi:hypothetical protein